MVKSYDRYEQEKVFGVITSDSNVVHIPGEGPKLAGRAITSALEEIVIWDIRKGEPVVRLSDGVTPGASNAPVSSSPATVTYLQYHSDTNLLAAGYSDGSIKIWDIASGSVLISFQGHKSAISIMTFDRNGTVLVSGSSDSSIIFWDLVGEEGLFKLTGHKGQITGLAFLSAETKSPDSDELDDYLVSVSKDGLVKLWETKSRVSVETHIAHSSECWALAIDRQRNIAITSGSKDQIKVWKVDLAQPDSQKLQEVGDFEKQSKSRCTDIEFKMVRRELYFYLQNADRTIEIYRVRTDSEVEKGASKRTKRLKEKGYTEDEVAQSLEESRINMLLTPYTTLRTSAKIKACCWVQNSHSSLDLLLSLSNNVIEYFSVAVPESKNVAVSTSKLYSVDLLGHRTDIRAMDISSDGKTLVTVSNGELKVWNLRSFNVIRSIVLESGYSLCCKFLPGDTLVVVGFKSGALELYDLASSALVDKVENAHGDVDKNEPVWTLDVLPDGKSIVTGGNDKTVKFWRLKVEQDYVPGTDVEKPRLTLKHYQTLEVNEEVLAVKVSPDSRLLAVSLLNNNVQVVYTDSLKLFLTLYGHKLPVLSIDISSDSKLIVTSSADKNVKIWGLDFGDCHKSIFAHQDSIMNVQFIPESHNFFSSGKDGLIKYWDGDKFECIQQLPAHQSEVWSLSVSHDGVFFVSTSHDHSIRLWSATNDQVFLEEEREKEMDELYEDNLLESLEEDKPGDDDGVDEVNDEATKVSQQATETLKASEKLMEALDVGWDDYRAHKEYDEHLRAYEQRKASVPPTRPTPPTLLVALNTTGHEHVLTTLTGIKPSQLDDALIVLPFSYTLKLLTFIEVWTSEAHVTRNLVNMSLICRTLFFVVRNNARELAAQKDPHLKQQFINTKSQLAGQLGTSLRQLGHNTQGLRFAKQQWKLTHEYEYIDDAEQRAQEDQRALKRTYTTI